MSQKTFTLIPYKPGSLEKFTLTPRFLPDRLFCAHMELDENGTPRWCEVDSFNDHYPCGVCGGYYCWKHISEKEMGSIQDGLLSVCLSCAKLTHEEWEKIIALRKEIEKG